VPQDKKNLLVKPVSPTAVSRGTLTVTPESTGYRYLTLSICKLPRGERFQSDTGAAELGLVIWADAVQWSQRLGPGLTLEVKRERHLSR
jgi:5-deoxy-D-glucuronate isomerase